MDFELAKTYVMPLGKHKGKALDEIAKTDRGLLYLDWLIGQPWVKSPMKGALESYLGDPAIQKEIEEAIRE